MMALESLPITPAEDETEAGHHQRWVIEIRRELSRWERGEPCTRCGEWVGHFGGSIERDPCPLIPLGIHLEEVRPNCNVVYRYWIGDAIRAAIEKRAA